ncbi:hypothetical protein CY35_15G010300 [Sphagnum magellanicum]|nr:hypothetical protein CY35_15G010300 [Sphagnum magellanicum]
MGILGTASSRVGDLWYGIFFRGLLELRREFLQDVEQVLKLTGKSVAGVRADVRSHGQVAWQMLSHGYLLPPIVKIVTAASFACTRCQVVPCIFALIVGEFTLAYHGNAEAEQLQIPSPHTQAPHHADYFVSLIVSLFEGSTLLWRVLYLAVLFSPAVLLAPFADLWGGKYRKNWLHLLHLSLEQAGAAFIKWGQWAATRPDLFPRDLCSELSKLHSKAPSHNFGQTRRTVEGAFGRKLHEIFEDFEEEPVASGSIAQVHRAVLRFRYPGQKSKPMVVAVKVRHPGVGEVIRRDFTIISWIANVCGFFPGLRWLRLHESVQQFASFMLTQVDLSREAAHLSRFIYNFRRWKDVSFPKPLYPLVHPAVLVESYEQGESVARFVDRPGKTRLNSELASIGTNTLLKMMLVDNFVHADLHPGNILVRMEPGNPAPNKQMFRSHPHVVLLDVGMTAELSQRDRYTLLNFFKALAVRDGREAAKCTLRFSQAQGCPNPAAFIDDVDQVFRYWKALGDSIQPGQCMQELLERVRRHKVNIDGDVCTVMVTTLVLEGWQRKLDPELNFVQTLNNLLFKADWQRSLSYMINGLMAP